MNRNLSADFSECSNVLPNLNSSPQHIPVISENRPTKVKYSELATTHEKLSREDISKLKRQKLNTVHLAEVISVEQSEDAREDSFPSSCTTFSTENQQIEGKYTEFIESLEKLNEEDLNSKRKRYKLDDVEIDSLCSADNDKISDEQWLEENSSDILLKYFAENPPDESQRSVLTATIKKLRREEIIKQKLQELEDSDILCSDYNPRVSDDRWFDAAFRCVSKSDKLNSAIIERILKQKEEKWKKARKTSDSLRSVG